LVCKCEVFGIRHNLKETFAGLRNGVKTSVKLKRLSGGQMDNCEQLGSDLGFTDFPADIIDSLRFKNQ
jgi:hypothetical protein